MKIAIIGCGVMGSAFARQFAGKGYAVILSDRNLDKGERLAKEIGGKYEPSPNKDAKQADILLLAIKPKDFKAFALTLG